MDVQTVVSQTVGQIRNLHFNDSSEEFLKCIIEFYSKCPIKSIRTATMDLITETHKSLSLSKDAKDEHLIYKIYNRFKTSMKDRDENDVKIIDAAEVPENTWLNAWIICFETFMQYDITKRFSFSALDQLFHIRTPETEGRKALIEASVQKLLRNKDESSFKTVIGLILSYLSFDFSTFLTVTQSEYPIKSLRTATMELIIKTYNTFFTWKDVDCFIEHILNRFEMLLEGEKIDNVDSAKVPRNTWVDAFEICFKTTLQKKSGKSLLTLDQLFHIREPETNDRKAFIYESIRQLLKNEKTFKKGIQLIVSFDMKILKEEEFENILFYSFIYAKGRSVTANFFASFEDKLRCLQILDDCFARAQAKKSPKTEVEKEFLDSVEAMPEMIHRLAKTSGINIEEHNFHSCKAYFIQNLKSAFNFTDKLYFNLYVLVCLLSDLT
uniref:Uncharacterized protein n=1 Tax=Panagrolaimus davidi TaxID=227884 RepID=A0A914PMC8_9BILA